MPARARQEPDGPFRLGDLREDNKEAIYKGVAGIGRLNKGQLEYLASNDTYRVREQQLAGATPHPGGMMESAIQQEWQPEQRQKCHQPSGFPAGSELEDEHPDLSSLPLPFLPALAAASHWPDSGGKQRKRSPSMLVGLLCPEEDGEAGETPSGSKDSVPKPCG